MELSRKQVENIRSAHRRWNVCEGAVRSGKSWLAVNYTIPDRVTRMADLPGIFLILGVSLGNIERNVLSPMRETFGPELVGQIKGSQNTAEVFGQRVYCLGAEGRKQVAKLQGAAVKFCYCDELAALSPDVFEMLKSRLSFSYSECHAACNPGGPRHWLKTFLDSTPDAYRQHYTIDDNPFLDPGFVASLKREYEGTVYYSRYIEGNWTQAEGLVYPMWRDALEQTYSGEARRVVASMDYGTLNATCALMWAEDPSGVWHAIGEYWHSGRETGQQKTDAEYTREIRDWAASILPDDWQGKLKIAVDPSAASIQTEMAKSGAFRVVDARNQVLEGVETVASAMRAGAVKIGDCCKHLAEELDGYVWEDREGGEERPVKVADHACDALRYGVMTFGMYNPRRLTRGRERA